MATKQIKLRSAHEQRKAACLGRAANMIRLANERDADDDYWETIMDVASDSDIDEVEALDIILEFHHDCTDLAPLSMQPKVQFDNEQTKADRAPWEQMTGAMDTLEDITNRQLQMRKDPRSAVRIISNDSRKMNRARNVVFNKRIEHKRLREGEPKPTGYALVGVETMTVDPRKEEEMREMERRVKEIERQKYEKVQNMKDSPTVVRKIEMKQGGLVKQTKQAQPLSPRSERGVTPRGFGGGGGSPGGMHASHKPEAYNMALRGKNANNSSPLDAGVLTGAQHQGTHQTQMYAAHPGKK